MEILNLQEGLYFSSKGGEKHIKWRGCEQSAINSDFSVDSERQDTPETEHKEKKQLYLKSEFSFNKPRDIVLESDYRVLLYTLGMIMWYLGNETVLFERGQMKESQEWVARGIC